MAERPKHDNHKLLHSPTQSIDSTGTNSLKSTRTLGSTRTSIDSDKSSIWKQHKSSYLSDSISLGDTITNYGNVRKPKLLLNADSKIMCLDYIQDVDIIVGGLSSGKVFLYHLSKNCVVQTLEDPLMKNKYMAITCVKSLSKQRRRIFPCHNHAILLTGNVDGTIQLWNWHENYCLFTVQEDQSINTITVAKENFATGGKKSCINLYDINTSQLICKFQKENRRDIITGHSSRVFSIQFHPLNENEFISGGWDNLILFWDKRTQKAVGSIFGPHICGEGIDIDTNGQEILTCSWRKEDSVQLWDYNNRKLLSTLKQQKISPKNYCGKWATDGVAAYGGTDPNALCIVNTVKDSVIGGCTGLPGGVYSIQCFTSKTIHKADGKSSFKRNMLPNVSTTEDSVSIKSDILEKLSLNSYRKEEKSSLNIPSIAFCSEKRLYYIL